MCHDSCDRCHTSPELFNTSFMCSAEGEWCRTPKTHLQCVLGVLQEGNGGGDAEHIEHTQTDVFDVFGVSGWMGEAPNTLSGDIRWKRH